MKPTEETVTTWANGFGLWHARISLPMPGYSPEQVSDNMNRLRAKARRAIRREVTQRGNAGSGWRCHIAIATTDWDELKIIQSITFREVFRQS